MKKSTIESIKKIEKEAYDRMIKDREKRFSPSIQDQVNFAKSDAFYNGVMSIIDQLGIDV